jgi:ADP-ribose pyrophosphatase
VRQCDKMKGGRFNAYVIGFCNTNLNYIHVKVDVTDPRNQNPKQELEAEEYIEVFTLPLSKLYTQCRIWDREGYAIDARVGSLAEGFEVAKKYKFF